MKNPLTLMAALIAAAFGVSGQTVTNYQATILSQGPMSYFTLDALTSVGGNYYTNQVATNSAVLNIYGPGGIQGVFAGGPISDAWRNASNAVAYGGASDMLMVANGSVVSGGGSPRSDSTAEGSVSLLFRTIDNTNNTGRRYLFCAGGSWNSSNAFEAFFESTNASNGDPGSLKLRVGSKSVTILPAANIAVSSWYYLAVTYTELSTTNYKAGWYLGRPGGTLASGTVLCQTNDVMGDGVRFTLGNYTNYSQGFYNPGKGGIDEFASWSRRLTSGEITAQFTNLPNLNASTKPDYQSFLTNQAPYYYFTLDGSFVDLIGGSLVLKTNSTGITFGGDWFGVPGSSASLSLANDAITNAANLLSGGGTYNPNTPGTGKGALSCLFKVPPTNAPAASAFVYTTPGAIGTSNNFSLVLAKTNNNLQVSFGNATKTIRFGTNMVPGDWYYFALNYDETVVTNQVTWWLGQPGTTLSSGVIAAVSNSLAGAGTSFVIGNSTTFGSGFRGGTGLPGQIDEFAIWHRLLSGTEVTNQFNALVAVGNPSVSLPAIAGISPASGVTNGGTTVTITGQNFLPGATVQFGTGAPVVATYIDGSTLTVVTPANPQGSVDVKLVNTNGTSNVRGSGFYYAVPAQPATLVSSTVDTSTVPPNLNLVWSGAANATSILLMATNLTPPVVWTPVVTNSMGTDGLLTNSVPISAEPSVFFRLQN